MIYREIKHLLTGCAFLGLLTCLIWIGIFFGCFYNNLQYDYIPVQDCSINDIKPIVHLVGINYKELQIYYKIYLNI